jgi:hypothetical protein
MNGVNPQPPSLIVMGPVTWSLYVDTYFAWQFWAPQDHTIFPTTTAPRHDEISINLAHVGVDVTGLDGPIGRLYVQYGSMVATIAGQDTTTTRGFFLTNPLFQNIEQAAAGWHFHAMHGINAELGIFPSYVGLESYLPEENWCYTHAFIADATPYYFVGFRGQAYPTARLKIELWVVNGWQSFGQWHEAHGGGLFVNWRPQDWLSLASAFYVGQEVQNDPNAVRYYTDSNLQIKYFSRPKASFLQWMAISAVGDVGYESRGNAPSGPMGGATLSHRWEWTDQWKTSLRVDFLYDATQAISPRFPVGAIHPFPATNPFAAGGITATLDYWPSPWLVTRLEYSHRIANQDIFSGPGGITGPGGILPATPAVAATFLPDLRTYDDRLIFNVTLRL